MLQWEWPTDFSVESREAIRVAMETSIRKAMAGGGNSQIRGTVSVDLPHLGSAPPELTLSGIRSLSVEHTALVIHARYDGDFQVTLRGLSINLDTINSNNGDEPDSNHALPFFLPFEMTLKNVVLDGMVSVEFFVEVEAAEVVEKTLPSRSYSSSSSNVMHFNASHAANNELINANRAVLKGDGGGQLIPSAGRAAAPTSGYGVLLGAGGRRAMRPPESVEQPDPSRKSTGPSTDGSKDTAAAKTTSPPSGKEQGATLTSLISKKATIAKKSMKVQFFGDPLKSFNIKTNFGTIPSADSKVEGLIRMLITPTIERVMTDGITVRL
ncbi:hypothetical protein, conserved [Angomonas deanei]|uniref:Uncharacterized protein n=1 Tax=Angomonas deanei TaxID=59799 RepID=A0A7G2CHU2_9TRYP|nr:hypothetical protein, conserved [Angomonas deanei]